MADNVRSVPTNVNSENSHSESANTSFLGTTGRYPFEDLCMRQIAKARHPYDAVITPRQARCLLGEDRLRRKAIPGLRRDSSEATGRVGRTLRKESRAGSRSPVDS